MTLEWATREEKGDWLAALLLVLEPEEDISGRVPVPFFRSDRKSVPIQRGKLMTISLSKDMQRFVETQAAEEGYASPSDYLNAVLKEAQKRKARKNLEAKLDEALASGPGEPMTREDWDELERKVWERDRAPHPEGSPQS